MVKIVDTTDDDMMKENCILCGNNFVIGEDGHELGFCLKCQKKKDFPYDINKYYEDHFKKASTFAEHTDKGWTSKTMPQEQFIKWKAAHERLNDEERKAELGEWVVGPGDGIGHVAVVAAHGLEELSALDDVSIVGIALRVHAHEAHVSR